MICTAHLNPTRHTDPNRPAYLRASAARRSRVLSSGVLAAAAGMRDAHIQTGQLRAQRVEGGRAARLVRALNARTVAALLADVAGEREPLGGHGAQTGQRLHGHLREDGGGGGGGGGRAQSETLSM